jgi:hypothetical protein
MDALALELALHGALVLVVSLVAGLFTYRAILGDERIAAWHLAHAGGSARGILLIALAPIMAHLALPAWQRVTLVWLVLFFVWTSVCAMLLAAATGQRGLRFTGSVANRLVYTLYVVGTIAVFPAGVVLVVGLLRAL